MRRINRILATFLVASVLFLNACKADKREDDEGETEEPPDLTLFNTMPKGEDVKSRYTSAVDSVLNVKKAQEQAIKEEREKYRKVAEERAIEREAERQRLLAIERENRRKAAAEKKRKGKVQLAQSPPPSLSQGAVSRGSDYVGQAQSYEATHYTAFCPTGCTGVTASGYDVRNTIYFEGMRILAAPKHIPLYSVMRVTYGDGTSFDGIVLDRGGDIGVGRLDVLVSTRDEAYRLGRQSVEIRMIRKGR